MLKLKTLTVHTMPFEDDRFFVFLTSDSGTAVDYSLGKQLFLWHQESFFGTELEVKEADGMKGFMLSAWQWISLLKNDRFHSFIQWHFDPLTQYGLSVAPVLYEAVVNGEFSPVFDDTDIYWEPPAAVWEEFNPDFWEQDVWKGISAKKMTIDLFQRCVHDFLSHSPVFQKLHEIADYLQSGKLSAIDLQSYWADGHFRQWAGFVEDPVPFSIGLRLSEPENDQDSWILETVLQSKKNPEKIYSLNGRIPPTWKVHLPAVLAEQTRWLRLLPELQENEKMKTALTEEEAWTFLTETSEKLIALGIAILLPSWWESIRQASFSISARVRSQSHYQRTFVGLNTILDFDWRISLNGEELAEEEFQKLVSEKRRLVKVNGQWVPLDPKMIQKIQQLMEEAKKKGIRMQDVLTQEFTGDSEEKQEEPANLYELASIQIQLNRSLQQMIEKLQHIEQIPLQQSPASLKGTLRPYQQIGMSWLLFLRSFRFGAILADDMGLGKTIQLIAYLLHVKEKEKADMPALIICPTSVLGNWQKELEHFAPDLRVLLHYGQNRLQGEDFAECIQNKDVVLTSYGLSHLDFETLSAVHWSTIALDEAQNIKNAHTKQSRAIRKLTGNHHIALTGTPMENRLSELWSIFDFTNHGYLGSYQKFQKNYIIPIEKERSEKKIRLLQARIRPFLLRRTKKDPEVELNLPDKLEQKQYCPLTAEQAALYEEYVQETLNRIEQLSAFERRGVVLQMLNKLKQLCDHPALYLKETRPSRAAERSHKLAKLLELVQEILEQKEACLIFTQYITMGEMIQQEIESRFQIKAPFLNGSMPKLQRDRLVSQFQDGEFPVFILSLKAGGTGLNLTAANHVIHYDRWWNPAVENQATDRAYRIGQHRFVHVHKLIATGTLEEKIDKMIEEKQELNEKIIQSDQWITELSNQELEQLLKLEPQG
ncbi:DEAD/DEAH box helicase [Bacillus smithii]|uniref:DEAD/DEAH box helicase n=1 Tax=Bacillus smithii TaxID=1479 RepID=UPI002E200A73|nr:DEAD/DEAH box helicase [Bacillus smithii]MED1456447.1 DEAD/DEAH box helicase [Bacillus smithii]